MTIEMTIVPTSADGQSYEIATRDVTGISDIDQLRFMPEAEGSQYSRLLFFERDSSGFVSPGDLEALRNHLRGVYILINTRLTLQKRRSIFVGMAGIDLDDQDDYFGRTGIHPEAIDANCHIKLFQCLLNQVEMPPPNMRYWDLAIVIPRQNNIIDFFEKLCNTLNESKDFLPRHTSFRHNAPSRNRISSDSASFLMISPKSIPTDGVDYLIQLISSVIAGMGSGLLLESAKRLLRKRPKREESSSSAYTDQSFRQKIKVKKSNFNISMGDVTNNYENKNINIAFVTDKQTRPDNFDE